MHPRKSKAFNQTAGHWLLALVLATSLRSAPDYSAPYSFTALAGLSSVGSADGAGSAARFYHPDAVAVDPAGNLYVADDNNHTIRKITPAGIVTTFAGAAGVEGSSDGLGSAARFDHPGGVALDGAGNLYVADTSNHTIRKISPARQVTTLAGNAGTYGSADGTGSAALFGYPEAIAVDANGTIYVADSSNLTIRRITPEGAVTTFAGKFGTYGTDDGIGGAARFSAMVSGMAVGPAGDLYVADTGNNSIRKITPAGNVTTLAGLASEMGSADGPVGMARFRLPEGITVDATGNVYVADTSNHTIRKITPDGNVATIAGAVGIFGSTDDNGPAARFRTPWGLAVDGAGNLFVVDSGNNTIRKISRTAEVTTLAGLGWDLSVGAADGTGSAARFESAIQVAAGPAGEVYATDTFNHTIRRIAASGAVTTFAGSSTAYSGNNEDGPAADARFGAPGPIAVHPNGTIYVGERTSGTIRQISPDRIVTTLNGLARHTAQFDGIGGVAVDGPGNVYVSDNHRHTIHRITPAGVITTLAGSAGAAGRADGPGVAATFDQPEGLAVDQAGNLFVADANNHTIRRISPAGLVATLAGSAGVRGDADGTVSEARFNFPSGVVIDSAGNLFVADSSNSTVRRITPAGKVTTVAGRPRAGGNADGVGQEARFYFAEDLSVDVQGSVYVSSGSTIRKGQPAGPPVITVQPSSQVVAIGASAQLSVTASGAPAPAFQWYFNSSAINGATAPTLALSDVRVADAGDYSVVVSNTLGALTSDKATLSMAAAAAQTPASGAGSGGGGAVDRWLVAALLILAFTRAARPARIRTVWAMGATLLATTTHRPTVYRWVSELAVSTSSRPRARRGARVRPARGAASFQNRLSS